MFSSDNNWSLKNSQGCNACTWREGYKLTIAYSRAYRYCFVVLPSVLFLMAIRFMGIPGDIVFYSAGLIPMLLMGYAITKPACYYVIPKDRVWIHSGRKTTFSDTTLLARYQQEGGLYQVVVRNDRTSQAEMVWRSFDKGEVVHLMEVVFACVVNTTVINEHTGEFRYSQELGLATQQMILEKKRGD